MTVATDPYKDLLFNDGEGADFNDFNSARALVGARVMDQLTAKRAPQVLAGSLNLLGGEDPAVNQLAFVATPLDCYLYSSAGNEVRVAPGTVFQKVTARTGLEPTMLAYEVDASAFAFNIGPGDATNPRIDIIQIKLEWVNGDSTTRVFEDAVTHVLTTSSINKSRRVRATCTVKVGTPAVKPTVPTPDAGNVILGAIRVGTGAITVLRQTPTVAAGEGAMWSLGVPLGVRAVTVHPANFDYVATGGNWTHTAGFAVSTGAATGLRVHCPQRMGRIVGISMAGAFPVGPNIQVGVMTYTAGTATFALVLTNMDPVVGLAGAHVSMVDLSTQDATSIPNAAGLGLPIWCNAYLGPGVNTDIDRTAALLINATANASKVGPVTFWVAGG